MADAAQAITNGFRAAGFKHIWKQHEECDYYLSEDADVITFIEYFVNYWLRKFFS